MKTHDADMIENRLIDFGARIILLSEELAPTRAAQHVAHHLLRAGTAPAPNYGEARGAESRADFIRKLAIALKELNETKVWLKMMVRARLASEKAVAQVLDECQQLGRTLNASVQTARRRGAQ